MVHDEKFTNCKTLTSAVAFLAMAFEVLPSQSTSLPSLPHLHFPLSLAVLPIHLCSLQELAVNDAAANALNYLVVQSNVLM